MEVDGGDPSSVNKNPRLIKAAQEEVATLDILVCGTCHYVYHFIEEFQEHKNAKACGKPTFKANLSESKPQVWAFLLWKSSMVNKHKTSGSKEPINSWKLYQQWCRMNEKVRDAWVVAGKNIQQFSSLANAKMAEVHSNKGAMEVKPKVVTTKSSLTDEDDEEEEEEEEKGDNENQNEEKASGIKSVRRIIRIPAEKNVNLKEIRGARNVHANKDLRTYTARKITENEESIENIETTEMTNAAVASNDGTEENESSQELGYKPDDTIEAKNEDNIAMMVEIEKETERIKKDGSMPNKTVEKTFVKNPLGDGMVEIKVENASSEDELDHVEEQEVGDKVSVVHDKGSNAVQRPGTVKRKPFATNRAIRSKKPGDATKNGNASSEDEYVVEKILAKRFNPKKKCFEYLLKWEGYPHDQNTWEPVENMAACDKLVETFEANLAKQRAANQRGQGAPKQPSSVHTRPVKVVKNLKAEMDINQPGPSGVNTYESRPVRSSKKRALEQVKSWCGTMQRKEFEIGKRKFGEESDTDDDFDVLPSDKKIKLEPPDEEWSGAEMDTALNSPPSSEEEGSEKKKKLTVVAVQGNQSRVVGTVHRSTKSQSQTGEEVVKRGPGRPPKRLQALESSNTVNGIAKNKTSVSEKDLAIELGLASDSSPEHKTKPPQSSAKQSTQPPVLVANSKGVIKVDPRQVPNLTSGVYIVSNKSGIVKLDGAPGSPTKERASNARQSPQAQNSAGVIINKTGIQTGIVRKPLSPSSTVVRPLVQNSVKQAMKPAVPLKSAMNTSSGLVKVSSANKPGTGPSPRLGAVTTRPLYMSPRVLGSRPSLSSPRPLSVLSQRPGLLQSVRQGLPPRMPGMPLRPSLNNLALKRSPIGVPGIQTKITSAVRPKTPLQSSVGRSLPKAPSPAAQVKSGIKPIQAMLGKAVQQNTGTANSITSQQRLILPKKTMHPGSLMSANSTSIRPGSKVEDQKTKKPGGRGRGRGYIDSVTSIGRSRDSKLVENNGLHMEFHEVNSSSDSDDGFDSLPELPMGDLPPLEPDSPPRPFTLCPETGKVLGQAEGEPTPVPSPEPEVKSKEEPEEILPEKQETVSTEVSAETSQENQETEKETVLKLEMSPGGTTGTVVESNTTVPSTYVDTLRTQEGLTVTKISTTSTSSSDTQQQVMVTTSKIGGGISVPAKKLFADTTSTNSDASGGGSSSALNAEMVTITGEDGMVYHIATEQEHDGETMIVSADGNQCVYVTAEQAAGLEEGSVLTLDSAVAEAVAQLMPDQVNVIGGGAGGCSQFYVKEGDADSGQLMISSGVDQSEETTQAQIVAQVVQEGEAMPETGGTRRVVLLLPDGNLMMTEVDEEQYAALNIETDK